MGSMRVFQALFAVLLHALLKVVHLVERFGFGVSGLGRKFWCLMFGLGVWGLGFGIWDLESCSTGFGLRVEPAS